MHFLSAILSAAMVLGAAGQYPPGDQWNKKSILKSDRRIELPGIVLEPGTYVIKLQEGGEKRSIVQVLNREENRVLATFVALPDHRVRPEGDVEFSFHQTGANGQRVVQSWFYASDLVGLEFVYPKLRAKDLAKATDGHVMASNKKDSEIVAVTPNGKEIVIDEPIQTARRKPQ